MNRRPDGKQTVQRLIDKRGGDQRSGDQRGGASADLAEVSVRHVAAGSGGRGATASLPGCHPVRLRSVTSDSARPIDLAPRSWRQSLTMMSGLEILMLVPFAERHDLIAEYVDRGGGWPVLSASENAALLEFLASRLPDPSHACSLCLMEIALTRARLGAEIFVEPEYRSVQGRSRQDIQAHIEHAAWGCIERALQGPAVTESWDHIEHSVWDSVEAAVWDGIEREARGRAECEAWRILERSARNRIEPGRYASLVWFHAEPEAVLRALHGAPPPAVGRPAYPILFGPGVPNLCRAATPEEVVLWASLPTDDTAPDLVERLLAEGIVRYTD